MEIFINAKYKVKNKLLRWLSKRTARRIVKNKNDRPLVTFTFDDFPASAYFRGGEILGKYGYKATYFLSLGMLGCDSPSGRIVNKDELEKVIETGNEIGCHTYWHEDAMGISSARYAASIDKNSQELSVIRPNMKFKTFAYPIGTTTPWVKKQIERRFLAARGGSQRINCGLMDLNLVSAYFLDSRLSLNINEIKNIIDYNNIKNGWLVFATHDIAEDPGRYGCSCCDFNEIVKHVNSGGAQVLTMIDALMATGLKRV